MKKNKKVLITVFFIVISFLLITLLPLIPNKNIQLVSLNTNEVTSIGIAKWKERAVTIKDKDAINKLIKYFETVKLTKKLWHFGTPDIWDFRISIYTAYDDTASQLIECFYITYDGKVYKNNFIYDIDNFNYEFLISLLSL